MISILVDIKYKIPGARLQGRTLTHGAWLMHLGFPGTRSGDVSALLALEQRKAERVKEMMAMMEAELS